VKAILKRWLPVSVVISALIAFLQIIFGRDIGLWILGERDFSLSTTSIATFNWYGQIFLRPYATFPHPNVFAAFSTFSRYAGPKEAIFTALCRKNFGCSHFIVGRDHTGVGTFYAPTASHEIFDQFPDLGIIPVRFNQVFYSEKLQSHIHEAEDVLHAEDEKLHISGTQARQMLEKGELPPEWFMRPEIAQMIVDALNEGAEVFVKE
jgi:ATP sulfurylase